MRLAFREAITPPQGVALFEIPQNILYTTKKTTGSAPAAQRFTPDDVRSAGRPGQDRSRAIELAAAAERPLIAGGDGLFWSQAGPELREFVELTSHPRLRAPRRPGRGIRRASAGDSRRVQEALHRRAPTWF